MAALDQPMLELVVSMLPISVECSCPDRYESRRIRRERIVFGQHWLDDSPVLRDKNQGSVFPSTSQHSIQIDVSNGPSRFQRPGGG